MCCRDLVENKEVMGASIRPGTRQIMKLIKWLSRDDGRMGRWRKGGKVGGFKYVQTTFKYLVKPVNLLSRGQLCMQAHTLTLCIKFYRIYDTPTGSISMDTWLRNCSKVE